MKNILIVDDNEQSRKLVKYALKENAYSITEALDGENALEILLNDKPDLLILDWMMPQLSGRSMIILLDEILGQIEKSGKMNDKKFDVIIYSSVKMPDLNLPNSRYFRYLCYISKEWSMFRQIERIKKISKTKLEAA